MVRLSFLSSFSCAVPKDKGSIVSMTVRVCSRRGVNRLTDQRILTLFSPGFRIQSKLLTDLRILQLQWLAVFFNFWARSLDFACDKVRIVDLSDRQKCLFLFVFVCVRCCSFVVVVFLYGQDSPNVTQ